MPNISLANFAKDAQSEGVFVNGLQTQCQSLFIIRSLLYESQNQWSSS